MLLLLNKKGVSPPPPPPPPFAPTDIADMKLWLDSSDAASITSSGGLVSQWNDKSGQGNHATAAGVGQPTTGTRTVNSLNAIDFDGGSDFMVLPAGLYPVPTGDCTYFGVFATDSTGSAQRILSGRTSAGVGGNNWIFCLNLIGIVPSWGGVVHTTTFDATTYAGFAPTLDTSQHIGMLRKSGTDLVAYYDGTPASVTRIASAAVPGIIHLGKFAGGSSDFYNGTLPEFLVYGRALTDAEVNQVGNYLETKWGRAWADI